MPVCRPNRGSNGVGYNNRTATAGFSLQCPTFVPVDGTTVKFSDIQLVGGKGDLSETIQILDENGQCPTTYVWADAWYCMDPFEDVSEKPLPANGRGVYMHVDNAVAIQFAGQVEKGALNRTIPAGFSILGNSSNVPLTLGDLKLIGAKGDLSETIQVLDENGQCPTSYVWADGWYCMDPFGSVDDLPVAAGEGIYFHMDNPVTLQLPAQLAE